jgi:hypothetical protein
MQGASGPDWFAIVGAAGGTFAVVWTLWRAYRERERVWVKFYAFDDETASGHRQLVAQTEIVNLGTLPTQVVEVERVKKLPYGLRWPVRVLFFRTRDRWPLRWLLNRSRALFSRVKTFPCDVLPPRQVAKHRIEGKSDDVARWVREKQSLVVTTGVRWYVAKITDNRPPRPPNYSDAP